MSNVASRIVEVGGLQLVVMAHNAEPITDEGWESGYLSSIRTVKKSARLDSAANLCFADGRGPNAKQRSVGNSIFNSKDGYRFQVAVVTESMMVRGAVTALSWFNPLIAAFQPSDWSRAFAHVRLLSAHHENVFAAIKDLQREVPNVPPLNAVVRLMEPQFRLPVTA